MKKLISLAIIMALQVAIAQADNLDDFTKNFKTRFPQAQNAKIVAVEPDRLYAVIDAGHVIFTDEKMTYLIDGTVIDLKTNENLTQKILDKNRPKVDVSRLNLKNAIQIKKANNKQVIYIFSDPDCPYCRQLEKNLEQLNNVNVYIFPMPLDSIHPNATSVSNHILCSQDPSIAWHTYLMKQEMQANKAGTCDGSKQIQANLKQAQEFGIYGTPAIVFQDGEVFPGVVPADAINKKLVSLN